jgi:hypothetical protein
MDCRTAQLLLDFARPRPGELHPTDTDALEAHLAGCPECHALAQAERRIDDHLGRAMRDVPVPDHLQRQVLGRLRQARSQRRQRILAWTARLSAAAALLIAVGLGVWAVVWKPHALPELDLENLHAIAFVENHPTPEQVEEWFREQYGIDTVVPSRFNYHLLAHHSVAEIQGQRLPLLVFAHGHDRARVYIVAGKQFDRHALLHAERPDSGGLKVEVWQNPDAPDLAYVVIYSGGSLARFLKTDPHHAT